MKRRFPNNGREPNIMNKELLLARTKVTKGCWEWFGYKNKLGYGRVMIKRKSYLVHRLAMHLWNDFDLNSPLLVCHHCDNPCCINPNHLFVGTVLDNNNDKINKGRARYLAGEASPTAKLKAKDVHSIIYLAKSGMMQKDIAKKYNISRGHVCELVKGFYWSSIKEKQK